MRITIAFLRLVANVNSALRRKKATVIRLAHLLETALELAIIKNFFIRLK